MRNAIVQQLFTCLSPIQAGLRTTLVPPPYQSLHTSVLAGRPLEVQIHWKCIMSPSMELQLTGYKGNRGSSHIQLQGQMTSLPGYGSYWNGKMTSKTLKNTWKASKTIYLKMMFILHPGDVVPLNPGSTPVEFCIGFTQRWEMCWGTGE